MMPLLSLQGVRKRFGERLLFEIDELLIQLERAIDNRRKTSELEAYRSEEDAGQGFEIVGRGPAMQKLYKLIGQVSATDSTVLIRGESGTGKEVIARAIHRHSLRGSRRLVKVNCASIPETRRTRCVRR